MTDREFLQSLSLCPVCGKEKLMGDEKECLMCRAYKYGKLYRFRLEHPNYAKEHRMNTYYKHVENHECTNCGVKLEDDYKYKMCEKCLRRARNNLRRSRQSRGMGSV